MSEKCQAGRRRAVQTHRDLIAWREAMDLLVEIHRISRELPPAERFCLVMQMNRAALSIPANIAEGFGRESKAEFLRYLRIAQGSLRELETYLDVIVRLTYLTRDELEAAVSAANRTGYLMYRLSNSLHRAGRGTSTTSTTSTT